MLTKDELKRHAQEKEALAIVWGPYLIGSSFIVKTDHESQSQLQVLIPGIAVTAKRPYLKALS
jgi:hypothetical protein